MNVRCVNSDQMPGSYWLSRVENAGAAASNGPSFAKTNQIGTQTKPIAASTANATCQLYVLISQVSAGAEIKTPTDEPMLTTAEGKAPPAAGNHLKTL